LVTIGHIVAEKRHLSARVFVHGSRRTNHGTRT
jgi:hypothetical protein